MGFDVFISYSTKDAVAAKAACAAMEAAKIRCWMAPRDIQPGAKWGASIVRAINQCRVMVLIFSGNANDSSQVQREVDQAFSKAKTVVPLRIEDVKPADELAYYLDTVHWLDALTPPLERNLEKLVATVRALLSAAETAPPAPEAAVDALASEDARAAQAQEEARAIDERREETETRQASGDQASAPDAARAEQERRVADAEARARDAEARQRVEAVARSRREAQEERRAKVLSSASPGDAGAIGQRSAAATARSGRAEAAQEDHGRAARTTKDRSQRQLALAVCGAAIGAVLLLIIISGVLGSWFRSSPPPSPAVKPRDDSGPIAACSSRSVESKFFDLALDHYRVNSVLYRSKPMDRGGYCLVTFEDDAGKRLGSLRYSVSGHDNPDVVVNVIDWE